MTAMPEQSISVELPAIIQRYIDASNRHDTASILACFADDAVVSDEHQTLRGRAAIEDWIATTIAKYKFQFRPLGMKSDDTCIIVTIEVAGTFDGSPVTLDYRFVIENDQIVSLQID